MTHTTVSRKNVTIYTDGSSKGNPGPGGYGVVLIYGSHRRELSRGFRLTTNNRMELLAVIDALKTLKESCDATIYTDSRYVADALNKGWLKSWQARNWRKADKKPVLNVDFWKALLPLLEKHRVTFKWVKGHNDNPENERCDRLAVAAAEGNNLVPDTVFERENPTR